ncbi:MAG: hypothetical protein ACQEXJ_15605 [Myxococcota bacterium]
MLLAVMLVSAPSCREHDEPMPGSQSAWHWALVFEPDGLRLKHDARDFDVVVRGDSAAIWLDTGDRQIPIQPEALDPSLREQWDFHHAEMVRSVLLRDEPAARGDVRRIGDWRAFTTRALFALKHRKWPYALAAAGSSNGWFVSVGPDKVAYFLGFDVEAGGVMDADEPWNRI